MSRRPLHSETCSLDQQIGFSRPLHDSTGSRPAQVAGMCAVPGGPPFVPFTNAPMPIPAAAMMPAVVRKTGPYPPAIAIDAPITGPRALLPEAIELEIP